jgi:hypothetical protein
LHNDDDDDDDNDFVDVEHGAVTRTVYRIAAAELP